MIDRMSHVTELYDLKHCHDTNLNEGADYSHFMETCLSGRMTLNPTTSDFLDQMQQLMTLMLEANLPVRNYRNHTVDKYYDRHGN